MKPKLSENERWAIKYLIEDGRLSNTSLGERLNISSQAAGKLRKKLEAKGIIKGYSPIIDYEMMGVEVFAIAFFKFKSENWERLEADDIKKRIKGPHLIRFYRFLQGDTTHMVLYGFRNLKEMDNYFHILQTERGHVSELLKVMVLSPSSILKDSADDLFVKLIDMLDSDELARPEPPYVDMW